MTRPDLESVRRDLSTLAENARSLGPQLPFLGAVGAAIAYRVAQAVIGHLRAAEAALGARALHREIRAAESEWMFLRDEAFAQAVTTPEHREAMKADLDERFPAREKWRS